MPDFWTEIRIWQSSSCRTTVLLRILHTPDDCLWPESGVGARNVGQLSWQLFSCGTSGFCVRYGTCGWGFRVAVWPSRVNWLCERCSQNWSGTRRFLYSWPVKVWCNNRTEISARKKFIWLLKKTLLTNEGFRGLCLKIGFNVFYEKVLV